MCWIALEGHAHANLVTCGVRRTGANTPAQFKGPGGGGGRERPCLFVAAAVWGLPRHIRVRVRLINTPKLRLERPATPANAAARRSTLSYLSAVMQAGFVLQGSSLIDQMESTTAQ